MKAENQEKEEVQLFSKKLVDSAPPKAGRECKDG